MKGNRELQIKINISKNKLEKKQPNLYKYMKNSTNNIKNRNFYKVNINEKTSPLKEKIEDKKEMYVTKIKQLPKKHTYNKNDLIKAYSLKNCDEYKAKGKNNNYIKINNLSGYKQILDKMIQNYASNEINKEEINKLLKNNIINQKTIIVKKAKLFYPSLKKRVFDIRNGKIIKNSYTGDSRNIKKQNEFYINQIVKLQAFWRGYYLRKIVVKGLKKYYGLIFIYKLLKKYLLKRNIMIFEIIFGRKIITNKERNSFKLFSVKNNFVYSKKLFYNNSKFNSEKNSFSFSSAQNDNNKSGDNLKRKIKSKNFYSNDKDRKTIYSYNRTFTEMKKMPLDLKNKLAHGNKEINTNKNTNYINNKSIFNINNNSIFNINKNKNFDKNILTSSIIKGDEKFSKMGNITMNFFNKYEKKEKQPINKRNEFYFKKPVYKTINKNKKYMYMIKKINQNEENNLFSQKITGNKSNYDTYNSDTIVNNENNFIINKSLYNIYKYVFAKLMNLLKIKFYSIYYYNFLYQLKIKRKVNQIKLYNSKLLSVILKIEKKKIKKFLDVYRENVLISKANELLKNEKNKEKNSMDNKNNLINNKRGENVSNKENSNLSIKNKKEIIMKLLNIKDNYINNLIKKYFAKWSINSRNFIHKINLQSKNNKLNDYRYKTINIENNKITVNKKKIKIKRQYNLNNSQKLGMKSSNLSKEKKMRIIRRTSKPDEYFLLYNSYNKSMKDSYNKLNKNDDIFNDEIKNTTFNKIFYIISKLESKKLLFKFFIYWKKIK